MFGFTLITEALGTEPKFLDNFGLLCLGFPWSGSCQTKLQIRMIHGMMVRAKPPQTACLLHGGGRVPAWRVLNPQKKLDGSRNSRSTETQLIPQSVSGNNEAAFSNTLEVEQIISNAYFQGYYCFEKMVPLFQTLKLSQSQVRIWTIFLSSSFHSSSLNAVNYK